MVYLYDISGHEIAEVDTSGNNVEDDIWAGSRHLAMYYSNSTYFFNADQVMATAPIQLINRGGPCRQDRPEHVAADPTGAMAQTCTNMRRDASQQPRRPVSSGSGPYGDDFSCTGSLPTGRFAGYDTNDEYGLYHSPARSYSAALGRFMTTDPTRQSSAGPTPGANPQSLNGYAYVLDSPANLTDPLGLFPKLKHGRIKGVLGAPVPIGSGVGAQKSPTLNPRLEFGLLVLTYVEEWRKMHPGSPYPSNGFQSGCQLFSIFTSIAGGVPHGWLSPVPTACDHQFNIPATADYLQALDYFMVYYLSISSNGFFAGSPDLELALQGYYGGTLSGMNGNLGFAVDFGFPSFDFAMFFGGGGSSGNGCQIWDPCSM